MPSFDDVPIYLKPKLRLFLSVDLVGSTALKQQADQLPIAAPREDETIEKAGPNWVLDIANFYRDISARFASHWAAYSQQTLSTWPTQHAAKLWKINGDELIYSAELTSTKQCYALVFVWMQACLSFRTDLMKRNPKLDVKMSAWVAGFPFQNTEAIFPRQDSSDFNDWPSVPLHYYRLQSWYAASEKEQSELYIQDFIGPSIDKGFRISQLATPRKFSISSELAYVLSAIGNYPDGMDLKFGYDGQVALKGVLGGTPYPAFWIDTHDQDELSKAEQLLLKPPTVTSIDVHNFCKKFFRRHSRYVLSPFIANDTDLGEVPMHYCDRLLKLADECRKAFKSQEEYAASQKMAIEGQHDQLQPINIPDPSTA